MYVLPMAASLQPAKQYVKQTGGLGLFANVVMFWAGTIGEANRAAKLAAKRP